MKARERLANARACINDGRYAEALLDLVWFHDNALIEEPAFYGVRLSYALDDWVRLGGLYPPALAALEETVTNKTEVLLRGGGDRAVFRDIVAINRYLGRTGRTYSLYQALVKSQPELAQLCSDAALPSIVAAGDFQLAAQLIPDAETTVVSKSTRLNRDVRLLKNEPYSRGPARWAYVGIYVQDILQLIMIKSGIGEHPEAMRLKLLAISLIESPSLRREVQAGFVKRARAPRVR